MGWLLLQVEAVGGMLPLGLPAEVLNLTASVIYPAITNVSDGCPDGESRILVGGCARVSASGPPCLPPPSLACNYRRRAEPWPPASMTSALLCGTRKDLSELAAEMACPGLLAACRKWQMAASFG